MENAIKRSHERCRRYGVEPDIVFSRKIIDRKQLDERLERKQELIVTAEPFMNQLYDFVKGSNFFAILTDEEGCILSVIGDESILTQAFNLKMVPGAFMNEESIGTNAMGTALEEMRPVQLSGADHYIEAYHKWTCSATPIWNSQREIIGTLDLTGFSTSVHSHTLGMVVAAGNAIERMLEIKKTNEELALSKLYTEQIIDSIHAGILTTDLNGNILTVSKYVAGMFGFEIKEMKTMEIGKIFDSWERVKEGTLSGNNLIDEDVYVSARKNRAQFNLSTYPIFDGDKKLRNIIFVFKEVQKIRKLANRIMGRRAIYTFDKIIGRDENFLKVMNFAKKIADSRSNVLILGESGTGKELFAQAIHNHSDRREEPFVALNCGAIPRNLIESELFGYEEGAYTGAKISGQPGKFEIADGGTIFLDEIGEMPLDLQTRLLRVIEEGTVSRIGSLKETVVNVRVIAATNKDLESEVVKGNFRKDLYYRLNVLPLKLPTLKERKEDIGLLVEFFMERISKKLNKRRVEISEEIMQKLKEYEWPGNIRELENFVELMVNYEELPKEYISLLQGTKGEEKGNDSAAGTPQGDEGSLELAHMERNHIVRVLKINNGNITTSAKDLRIGRNTLYRKIEQYGILHQNGTLF